MVQSIPAIRQAAQRFEAQAMAQLLAPAFNGAATGKSPFGGGAAEAQWRPLLLDAWTSAAVRGGHGIGLADQVVREMLRWQDAGTPPEETR